MVFKFIKKVVKGVGKVFKKIGKGIKSAFKKIGKFMGKIGIIGQIGLALILPGVGQMLSGLLVGTGSTVGGLAGALQGMGAVGQAASSFIQNAVKVASNTSKFFSSVSDGVTQVVGDTIGAAAQSIGINPDTMIAKGLNRLGVNMDVDGWGGVFSNAEKSFGKITDAGSNLFNLDPLSEVSVPQRALKEIPKDSLMNEAPFDVTSPVGETVVKAPNLSTEPFGPVGEIDGITYETGSSKYAFSPDPQIPNMAGDVAKALQENIATQGGAGTAASPFFASGQVTKPTSLLDKVSEFITGKSIDENLDLGRKKIADAASDFIPETAKAVGREAIAQAVGVSPTPDQMTPRYYSSSVRLGDFETSIGTGVPNTSPYQGLIDQVGVQYASANPYGLMAQQFNFDQYQQAMKERGFA